MSAREAAVLLFVWFAVQAGLAATLLLQVTVITAEGDSFTVVERVAALLPIGFLIWVAFRLVRDRVRLAHAVFPDAVASGSAVTPRDVGMLGVTFIGLYVVIGGVPEFSTWALEALGALQSDGGGVSGPLGGARFLSAVVDVLAGGLLLMNRAAIADWIVRDSASEDAAAE